MVYDKNDYLGKKVRKSMKDKKGKAVKSKSKGKSSKKHNPKSRKACDVRNMLWLKKSDSKKAHCRKSRNSRK